MHDKDGNIIWQYSPEWQREMGIFTRTGAPASDDTEGDSVDPESIASSRPAPEGAFVPARDKLEAVNRISTWAGGPVALLGPGSTERKEVLATAAKFLDLDPGLLKLSKPELARSVVEHLGGVWTEAAFSSGSTITLHGLNLVLAGLETNSTPHASPDRTLSPADEASVILDVVVEHTPRVFNGRDAVTEMRNAESSDWAKSEWPGFYFEFRALGPTMSAVNGQPVATNTKTVFDLGGTFVWDFKSHSVEKPWAILNDKAATDWVVSDRGGIGLVVLSGLPKHDSGFKTWFDDQKAQHGKVPRPRANEPKYSRPLKSSFTASRVDLIYLFAADWKAALKAGVVKVWDQPRQPGGQARNPKYQIDVPSAVVEWGIAAHEY